MPDVPPAPAGYRLPCCNRPIEIGEFVARNDTDPPGYVTCAGCTLAKMAKDSPDLADAVRGLPLVIPKVRRDRLTAIANANAAKAAPTSTDAAPPPPASATEEAR
jgi:hypothetical protein